MLYPDLIKTIRDTYNPTTDREVLLLFHKYCLAALERMNPPKKLKATEANQLATCWQAHLHSHQPLSESYPDQDVFEFASLLNELLYAIAKHNLWSALPKLLGELITKSAQSL